MAKIDSGDLVVTVKCKEKAAWCWWPVGGWWRRREGEPVPLWPCWSLAGPNLERRMCTGLAKQLRPPAAVKCLIRSKKPRHAMDGSVADQSIVGGPRPQLQQRRRRMAAGWWIRNPDGWLASLELQIFEF
jgi:hypothetical protein